MALVKGALRCFKWLRTKSAGEVVSIEELMEASGWSEASVKTYFGKNKLSPFLVPLHGQSLKVMLDGSEVSGGLFRRGLYSDGAIQVVLDCWRQAHWRKGLLQIS